MMIRKISLLTILVVAPLQLSLAEPRIVEDEVTLRFSEQAMPEDIYLMIRKQANRTCGSRAVYPHQNLSGEAQCREQFIRDAVLAIDRPRLTALHEKRTGSRALDLAASDH